MSPSRSCDVPESADPWSGTPLLYRPVPNASPLGSCSAAGLAPRQLAPAEGPGRRPFGTLGNAPGFAAVEETSSSGIQQRATDGANVGGASTDGALEAPLTIDDVGWEDGNEHGDVPCLYWPALSSSGDPSDASLLGQASDATTAAAFDEIWGIPALHTPTAGAEGAGSGSPPSGLTEAADRNNAQLPPLLIAGSGPVAVSDGGAGTMSSLGAMPGPGKKPDLGTVLGPGTLSVPGKMPVLGSVAETGAGTVAGVLAVRPGHMSHASQSGAPFPPWDIPSEGPARPREVGSSAPLLDASCALPAEGPRRLTASNNSNAVRYSAWVTDALSRRLCEDSGAVPATLPWEVGAQGSGAFEAACRPGGSGAQGSEADGIGGQRFSSVPSAPSGPRSSPDLEHQRLPSHSLGGFFPALQLPEAPGGPPRGPGPTQGVPPPGLRPSLAGRLAAVLSSIQEREAAQEEGEGEGAVAMTEEDMEALQEMCRRRLGGGGDNGMANGNVLEVSSNGAAANGIGGAGKGMVGSALGGSGNGMEGSALAGSADRAHGAQGSRALSQAWPSGASPRTNAGPSGLGTGADTRHRGNTSAGAGLGGNRSRGAAPGPEGGSEQGGALEPLLWQSGAETPLVETPASGGGSAPSGLHPTSVGSAEGGSREPQGHVQPGPNLQHQDGRHQKPQQQQAQQEGWQQQQGSQRQRVGQQEGGQRQERGQQQQQEGPQQRQQPHRPQQRQQPHRPQQGQGLLKQLISLTQEQQQAERRTQKHIILGKGQRLWWHPTRAPLGPATPGTRAAGPRDSVGPPRGNTHTAPGLPAHELAFLTPPGLSLAAPGTPRRDGQARPEAENQPGAVEIMRSMRSAHKRALSPGGAEPWGPSCVRPKALRVLSPEEGLCLRPEFQRLVASRLMRLATAYAANQLDERQPWVVQLRRTAAPDGPVPQRLAHYFLQALGKRFWGHSPVESQEPKHVLAPPPKQLFASKTESERAGLKRGWGGFSEAVFTSTFLPPLLGRQRVHIVLFSNGPGPNWTTLFLALAAHSRSQVGNGAGSGSSGRGGGVGGAGGVPPPHVRVTLLIPFDGPQVLPQVQQGYAALGERVRASAAVAGVPLRYTQTFVRPSEYQPSVVSVDPSEAVVVGEYLAIHCFPDDSVLRRNPRDACLSWIRDLNPLVFTVIGLDANLSSPLYLERFGETLRLTAAILDNFDSTVHDPAASPDRPAATMMERLVAAQLMSCVAAQGLAQTMRSEALPQWRERLASMGFSGVPLGPEVFRALEGASLHPRLAVLPVQGCASLRWDDSPLVFALTAKSQDSA